MKMGLNVLDTYPPFPVHGMDDALGLKPSRLTWVCGGFAILGFLSAIALQLWTSVVDYPLVVGGKPLASIPAFVPVTFELTVLFAALGTVFTFLAISGLRPRVYPKDLLPGVNDDMFWLVGEFGREGTIDQVQAGLVPFHPVVLERHFHDLPNPKFLDRPVGSLAVLAAAFLPPVVMLGVGLSFNRDLTQRVAQFDAGMMYPIAVQAFDASPVLARGQVLQAAPEGTMPRGLTPLGFEAGKEEAVRAGAELKNPLEATPANATRGKVIWDRVCATCHGFQGKGDGAVIGAGKIPNPPNLLIPKYQAYADGQLFHVATFGGPEKIMKGFADQMSREDRWRAVMHLRSLQKEAEAAKAAAEAAKAAPPSAQARPGTYGNLAAEAAKAAAVPAAPAAGAKP
jgi:mono/diheme cytochrome c family protein